MLKAGELLYKKHVVVEEELDGYANIAAEFLPTYEIASATDPLFHIFPLFELIFSAISICDDVLNSNFTIQIIRFMNIDLNFLGLRWIEGLNQLFDRPVKRTFLCHATPFDGTTLMPRLASSLASTLDGQGYLRHPSR